MYKNKWSVMVNTCKESQVRATPPSGSLPLCQERPSLTEGRTFFITTFTTSALHPHNPWRRGKIKGIVPQFVFRSNVIFCVVMGCGMARSEGSLKLKIENSGLEVCQNMRFDWKKEKLWTIPLILLLRQGLWGCNTILNADDVFHWFYVQIVV